MKPFSKQELIGVTLIFIVVFGLTFIGLQASIRRSRDVQRKADLGAISDALHKFQEEFGFFPPSDGRKIRACKGNNFNEILTEIKDTETPYLAVIPSDPKTNEGFSYVYFSSANRFQLYAFLEGGVDEDEYNSGVFNRNLPCGVGICSFGKSSGETPLDISIEEYEQQLLEKSKTGN
ncbi:MAG: hypothetical protein UT61_C0003G0038 [Candidatus Woesebacteria bacterium GW2011_GWA1_39_8]|uniref:Type II secretion system protein GspG C-terminal domain-containing protein n=1 Tax=Candidatus Woesebacteria bacterium GW2011_GWA1_39_8 TaxID=1618552 RepID=A0A0G0S7J6_9BACT|nr:MAG: hypothetical protein UT61_C0003G0038 [Candidatus Woesebacteria bacterium GW2011_GWA1_39_8]